MVETRNDSEARRKVWEMIRDVEIAMLVTMDGEGRFRGRPMRAVQTEFEGTLWFFTQAGSPKDREVAEDDRVLLAYADPRRQNYVALSGSAETLQDAAKQRELWSEPLRAWFPGGPEDPKVALLKVEVDGAEYWDAPNSTMVHLYGYVKARLTGRPPEGGENAKVDFSRGA